MNHTLMPDQGQLYIVATPIGNLKDITYRAVEILKIVDVVYAEDTRQTRKLLEHYGLKQKIISCHEHNESARVSEVQKYLREGLSVALVSDAGTPLISDPGFRLVTDIKALGFRVTPIPGACALISALSVAGLPSDRFQFCGFLPSKSPNRKKIYEGIKSYTGTTIFYESVHRVLASIKDLNEVLGRDRQVVLAKELTKQYETVIHGSAIELLNWLEGNPDKIRGEYVLLIRGEVSGESSEENTVATTKLLTTLLAVLPLKQAVKTACEISGKKKNSLYELALGLKDEMKLGK
jgi:16S rRNA (cytidine1402-2'-O)-methyltransferase